MKTLGLLLLVSFRSVIFNCEAQDTWTQKADFGGTARYGAVSFNIGSKGYIGTGANEAELRKDFWEYDPELDAWTQKADFINERRSAVGFAIGNYGYLGTGEDICCTLDDFWQYDPISNTWTQKAQFPGRSTSRCNWFQYWKQRLFGIR